VSEIVQLQADVEPQAAKTAPRTAQMLPSPLPAPRSTMEMVQQAVMNGASIEVLERLMAMHERYEATLARKAFYEAKAEFKAKAPAIFKDMDNKQYGSKYSSIGAVVNPINEALGQHGLDTRWEFDQGEKSIKVTCFLTHTMGHFEKVSLSGPPDVSGQKNPIQQIKSTTTYLKLATFEAVTGVASKEGNANDDGNGSGGVVSSDQAAQLEKLADDTDSDKIKFCRYFKIEKIADLPVKEFVKAKGLLEGKRKS
jgi:hypothetical protein